MGEQIKILTLQELINQGNKLEDLDKELIKLDYDDMEGLTEEDEGDISQWLEVDAVNASRSYIALNEENKIIGYLEHIVMRKGTYKKCISGHLIDGKITKNMIIFGKMQGIHETYIVGIAVIPEYRHLGIGDKLFCKLLEDINSMKQEGVIIDEIVCDAYTNAGKHFFDKHGFEFVCKHINHGDIMVKKL